MVHQTLRSLSGPFENFIGNHRTENLAVWHSANRTLAVEASPKSTAITPAPFRGRSALLIDHHTRSAGEIFSFAWKRGKFGPIFGTRTKGAVVSGGTLLTPGGLLLYVAKIGHRIDGQVLEGKGVEPDHMIERPVPYSHGADPVLEAALDKLAGPATK